MLHMPKGDIDIKERSPLALAFVGDGVLELLARSHIVANSRAPAGVLHRKAVQIVSAKAQFAALKELMPILHEDELAVVKRGRNATKASVSKNASAEEYRASTGLEALFGWLYLQDETQRLQELFSVIWEHYLAVME